jgi:LAO/AO transport system kinase
MADGIVINKADGDNVHRSRVAQAAYQNALHLFSPSGKGWYPKVLTCSARESTGIEAVWGMITEHEALLKANGSFYSHRQWQNLQWMHESIEAHLHQQFYTHPAVQQSITYLESEVESGRLPPISAAQRLLQLFQQKREGV